MDDDCCGMLYPCGGTRGGGGTALNDGTGGFDAPPMSGLGIPPKSLLLILVTAPDIPFIILVAPKLPIIIPVEFPWFVAIID